MLEKISMEERYVGGMKKFGARGNIDSSPSLMNLRLHGWGKEVVGSQVFYDRMKASSWNVQV